MSTKRLAVALLLPPALLAGGCVDQSNSNRQEVAGAAGAESAAVNGLDNGVEAASANNGAAAPAEGGASVPAPEAGPAASGNIAPAADETDGVTEVKEKAAPGNVVVASRPAPADAGGKVTSPAGLVAGTLAVRKGCLVVVGATGVTTLPIFRQGSYVWDAGAGTLRYGGRTYRLGEKLTLGGGNLPKRSPFVADHRAIIDRCGTNDVFIVA